MVCVSHGDRLRASLLCLCSTQYLLTCPGPRGGISRSLSHDLCVCPRDQRSGSLSLQQPPVSCRGAGSSTSKPVHMDMLDPSLDPATAAAAAAASHDKGQETEGGVELHEGDCTNADEPTTVAIASVQQAAFADHNIQYQFRTENNGGQVTYRVVQVTDGQLDGQSDAAGAVSVVSTAAFASGQQAVTQVVMTCLMFNRF
ncbi:upstream stimulatory factor 2-like [Protopterus annectens]|uniref:upstream stimulatory factor 2-like n=1 Tax=Protopterus annectens TaxID=7888 RepID=UPI001CF9AB04|nr:upstream stimulatory factor 2-like [Protopterus annectens]